jgi:MFS family permease
MQRTAVVWVVYSITHSAFLLGVTIFAEIFPSFLFSIFGGIVADRYNRYQVIKVTQITSMIQAVLLAILVAMASLAQLLGPALLGIVLNKFGAAVCFFINAASFGGVIISLLLMKLPVHEQCRNLWLYFQLYRHRRCNWNHIPGFA